MTCEKHNYNKVYYPVNEHLGTFSDCDSLYSHPDQNWPSVNKRVIINETAIADDRIKEIIRFVRPPNIVLPPIKIKETTRSWDGHYWYSDQRIVLRINPEDMDNPTFIKRTRDEQRRGYATDYFVLDGEELLVYLLGHELRHAWQDQYPKAPRMGRTKRGDRPRQRFSELDTEAYALTKLARWRQRNLSQYAQKLNGEARQNRCKQLRSKKSYGTNRRPKRR